MYYLNNGFINLHIGTFYSITCRSCGNFSSIIPNWLLDYFRFIQNIFICNKLYDDQVIWFRRLLHARGGTALKKILHLANWSQLIHAGPASSKTKVFRCRVSHAYQHRLITHPCCYYLDIRNFEWQTTTTKLSNYCSNSNIKYNLYPLWSAIVCLWCYHAAVHMQRHLHVDGTNK